MSRVFCYSPAGDDLHGDGTAANPLRTAAAARLLSEPGDVVLPIDRDGCFNPQRAQLRDAPMDNTLRVGGVAVRFWMVGVAMLISSAVLWGLIVLAVKNPATGFLTACALAVVVVAVAGRAELKR